MRDELLGLLDDARGEMSTGEFSARLEEIHRRHLGDKADAPPHSDSRRRATKAFERLTRDSPSRHHHFELLAEAVGVDSGRS